MDPCTAVLFVPELSIHIASALDGTLKVGAEEVQASSMTDHPRGLKARHPAFQKFKPE